MRRVLFGAVVPAGWNIVVGGCFGKIGNLTKLLVTSFRTLSLVPLPVHNDPFARVRGTSMAEIRIMPFGARVPATSWKQTRRTDPLLKWYFAG